MTVKRSMSCFISVSLEKLGAGKFLHSSKDVLDKVLPALVQLTTDPSPEARYLWCNSVVYTMYSMVVLYIRGHGSLGFLAQQYLPKTGSLTFPSWQYCLGIAKPIDIFIVTLNLPTNFYEILNNEILSFLLNRIYC